MIKCKLGILDFFKENCLVLLIQASITFGLPLVDRSFSALDHIFQLPNQSIDEDAVNDFNNYYSW